MKEKNKYVQALNHLRKDPIMRELISEYGAPDLNSKNDFFNALIKSIIFQQLSGKSAGKIYHRFINLFSNKTPEVSLLRNMQIDSLRDIGLSERKSKYIIGLADYFHSSGKDIDFYKLSNIEVYNELINIKGIGPWTIDMFLMFTLGREDVLPVKDLGIQKGFQKALSLETLPSEERMKEIASKWRPYRTIACWYLWAIVDDGFVW